MDLKLGPGTAVEETALSGTSEGRLVIDLSDRASHVLAGTVIVVLVAVVSLVLAGAAAVYLAGVVVAGTGITYLSGLALKPEERLAFGTVIGGMAVCLSGFALALLIGFSAGIVLAGLAIALALGIAGYAGHRSELWPDLDHLLHSAGRLWPLWILLGVCWLYTLHLLGQAYTYNPQGLVVGHPAVYGDWAAHLEYAGSFAYGQNYPPQYPMDAGHRLGYPFMADFFAATLVPLGTSLTSSLVLTSGLLGLAFPAVMYLAGVRFLDNRATAVVATFVFLLGGGLGFVYLFGDLDRLGPEALLHLPREFTIDHNLNYQWLNPVLAYMYPQRSTLFGFSIALLTMTLLWLGLRQDRDRPFVFAGLLAGLTPLFHVHAYGTVVALAAFWLLLNPRRAWLGFFIPALGLGVPTLLALIQPGSTAIHLQTGWMAAADGHNDNWIWFWLKNTGIFIPLLIAAFFWRKVLPARLAAHLAPIWLWFLVPNIWVFQPWDWDNTKFFVFWALFGAFAVAALLVQIASRSREGLILAGLLLVVLTLSGALDLARAADYQVSAAGFADARGVQTAFWVRDHTDPHSVVLMSAEHNEPVAALGGRKLVAGYGGWLWTYGLGDWVARTDDVKIMLSGGDSTPYLVKQYGVTYVVIGPQEQSSTYSGNRAYWQSHADAVYNNGPYTVFKVR